MTFMDWYASGRGTSARAERLRLIGDDTIREFEAVKDEDRIEVKVTEDGRYRAEVHGSVSGVNHGSAADFLKDIARCLGGALSILKHGHSHHEHKHTHGHTHSH